jgi:hypothetical protein
VLRGEWLDAEYRAQKALALAEKATNVQAIAKAQVTLGVAAILQQDTAAALAYFQSAQPAVMNLVKINLSVLQGGAELFAPQNYNVRGVEEIDGVFPEDFLVAPSFTATVNLPGKIYCGYKHLPTSNIFQHYVDNGSNRFAWFHRTGPDYEGATLAGLSAGATAAEIHSAYGAPDRILSLPNGQCLAYDQRQLLLLTDEAGQLRSWIVFRSGLTE